MKNKNILRRAGYLLVLALLLLGSALPAAAKTKKVSVPSSDLQKGLQYYLTEMPHLGPESIIQTYKNKKLDFYSAQNFDFTPDGKYVFTIAEARTGSAIHSLLTRCLIPSSRGSKASAVCQEAFILEKYGHSDVLSVTQENLNQEVYDLWVACKPGKDTHGTQIARITYKVGSDGKGKITKTVYINGFEKSTVTDGKAVKYNHGFNPEWVMCAADSEWNEIMFRLKFPTGYGVHYVSYDLEKLDAALDKLDNKKTFDIAKAAGYQLVHISCPISPLGSFQNFAISRHTLYILGGHKKKGAGIYVVPYDIGKAWEPVSFRIREESEISKTITVSPKLKVDGTVFNASKLEVEGIKAYTRRNGKADIFLNFRLVKSGFMRYGTGIYRFTK